MSYNYEHKRFQLLVYKTHPFRNHSHSMVEGGLEEMS